MIDNRLLHEELETNKKISENVDRRETVLDEAKRIVYSDRNIAYGSPVDDASRFSAMMNAVYGGAKERLFELKDYALIMLLVKIGRESYKHKRDNAVDIAGYASVLARSVGDDE